MNIFKKIGLAAVAAIAIASWISPAQAQGIPVIDAAKLAMDQVNQATNVAKYVEMITQYKQQIDQMKQQYEALSGSRGLGTLFNDPRFKSYLPEDWQKVYDKVQQGGYKGLSGNAKALRDAAILFDLCKDKSDAAKILCERSSTQAAQQKAFSQDAFEAAQGRWDQIQNLMQGINETTDAKSIAEVQARINAETAAIQNEQIKLQMYAMMQQAEEKALQQAQKERAAKQMGTVKYTDLKPVGAK